ncbi:Zn-dependent hydrolase [Lentibacillus jeotgali]|uniref:Zn-dependent hydrolase n=1 Tax=Lentibacillus jeotgali TaxID=558169 RepID=UPI0002628437|nr:Zn-dependent hydrolase [Lentibacillus jeotgali]
MKANNERIQKSVEELSEFTKTPGNGVTRLSYSKEDLKARKYIKEKMKEYGLAVKEDGLGNMFGKLEGKMKDAPSVIVGSHFDSVPNGGAYDGAAGVIAGLEVAALFQQNKLTPNYPLEVIAMIEEEGSRFRGLMGSSGITGSIKESDFKDVRDFDGVSATEAMSNAGLDKSLPTYRDPQTIKAFLEMHIEQGPILEENDIPIGVVQSIVGLTQLNVTITGRAGHAGTTPMDKRSDAVMAATNIISKLPQLAINEGNNTVLTVGRLQVSPNAANVIPDDVNFTIDIRSGKEEHILNVLKNVREIIRSYNSSGIKTSVEQRLYIKPKALSEDIHSILSGACANLNISHCTMNSGAGHDAMVFSDVTDVGLIFVPSKNGLSHCPEEFTHEDDLARGANVLYETAKKLTEG